MITLWRVSRALFSFTLRLALSGRKFPSEADDDGDGDVFYANIFDNVPSSSVDISFSARFFN